jgi:peptide/nickel transport system substrate-binding protein
VANKENKWLGRNVSRYQSKEADEAYKASQKELDPAKRAAYFIKMDEIFCEAHILLPLLARTRVNASANTLVGNYSGWDSDFWQLNAWYRKA